MAITHLTSIPTLMSALADRLADRTWIVDNNVAVFSGPIVELPAVSSIQLIDADQSEVAAFLGSGRREETYNIQVIILGVANGPDVEAAIRNARNNAFAILGELATELRLNVGDMTVGGAVRDAQLSDLYLQQGSADTHRVALIGATLRIKSFLLERNPDN